MISQTTIKTLMGKYQTTKLNIKREYLQNLFLSYFYQQNGSENIFFKGGTALRIAYKSPRFSEDLDFSSNIKEVRIEQIIIDTLSELEKEGFFIEVKDATKTSGGYLSVILFDYDKEKISLKLEISLRKKEVKGEIITIINDFIPAYTIMLLLEEELIGEKIEALLTRQKARDFYDFYFILRLGILPIKYKYLMKPIMETVKKTNIQFEKELKIFLPKSHILIVKNFKPVLERELERYV